MRGRDSTLLALVLQLPFGCNAAFGQALIGITPGLNWSFPDNGKPALQASLGNVSAVAIDATGNLLLTDRQNNMVFRVDNQGILTTVAGNGINAVSGDGGTATAASLIYPRSVAVDRSGNIYVNTYGQIRKITPSGTISSIAGTGAGGPPGDGDGGPATKAFLFWPEGIAVDLAGNLYIAEPWAKRIRRISPDGIIRTVVGTGESGFGGDGGPATRAILSSPQGVAVDTAGTLFIADVGGYRVRKVTPDGIISTVAGNGSMGFSGDGGLAVSASLLEPDAVAIDSAGNLYITDFNRIRKVTPNGIISTVAGNGQTGFSGDSGIATQASLNYAAGLSTDQEGNLYVADLSNDRVRKITPAGIISTIAGTGDYQSAKRVVFTSAGSQAVYVSSVGSVGGAFSFSISGHTGSGGNWLTTSTTSTTTPALVTITVDPHGLAPGTYSGTVTILALAATNSPQTISVTLTVSMLTISKPTLVFTGAGSQTITLGSSGAALSFTASVSTTFGGSWLSVSPTGGTTPTALTVSVTATLQPGSYEGAVTIAALEASNSPVKIPVSLVLAAPSLIISTTSLPTAVEGLPYGPIQFGVTGATGTTTWSVSGLPVLTGLSLSLSGILSGSPAKGSQGVYLLTVTVANSGSTATAQFTLTISAASMLEVLNFRLVPSGGGDLSDKRVFIVANDSSRPATVRVVPSAAWMKTSTSQVSLSDGSKSQPVSVQIDRTALPPGSSYISGTIGLQGLSSPKQVEVNVALQDQRGLPLLSRSAMTFYIQQRQLLGEGDNLEQTVTIINDGFTPVGWNIVKSDSFVSVDPSSSTAKLQPGASTPVKVTVSDT